MENSQKKRCTEDFRYMILSHIEKSEKEFQGINATMQNQNNTMQAISGSLVQITTALQAFGKNSLYIAGGVLSLLVITIIFCGSITLSVLDAGMSVTKDGFSLNKKIKTEGQNDK